jgi:hypothetical protein
MSLRGKNRREAGERRGRKSEGKKEEESVTGQGEDKEQKKNRAYRTNGGVARQADKYCPN